MSIKRYGSMCYLKPDKKEEYIKAHKNVWPEVVTELKKAGILSLSIFLRSNILFMYLEHDNKQPFEQAMQQYLHGPKINEWEILMAGFKEQNSVNPDGGNGFLGMDEIYHLE